MQPYAATGGRAVIGLAVVPMPLVRTKLSHAAVHWLGFCVVMALLIVVPFVLPIFWAKFLTKF